MSMLDSPCEGLAIGYVSYGLLTAVNNIWAWAAVITAAVGFWRIKCLSSPPHLISREVSPLESSSYPAVTAAAPATVSATTETKHFLPATRTMSYCVLESECSPKGKFSVYYKDNFKNYDEVDDDESDGGCNEGGAEVEREKLGWRCCEWERMMVVRLGDLGWYRYQDLTVLDGSVVRLWDGRWRSDAAAALVVDSSVTL